MVGVSFLSRDTMYSTSMHDTHLSNFPIPFLSIHESLVCDSRTGAGQITSRLFQFTIVLM
jgi:hypothetical protein